MTGRGTGRRIGVISAVVALGIGGTVTAAAPAQAAVSATTATADVDYVTWQSDVKAVIDQATPYVGPTPALKPSLALAKYAKSRGVDIFFVTARPGIIYSLTEWNLTSVGYPVDGLYVRDLPDLFGEVSAYKTAQRAEIESKGYTIIANVGNNGTDLVGGHAERTFKLPDYDGQLS